MPGTQSHSPVCVYVVGSEEMHECQSAAGRIYLVTGNRGNAVGSIRDFAHAEKGAKHSLP